MRHLITGGAGFIGSHLAETLLARGDEVFVLDDLSTGSVENIRHLKTHARFHYAFDSITNKHLLAELVDESDVIFHLAAAVGVRLIVESPVRTLETNVYGTQLVLDAASKKKKLVVTASTSEVYGKSNQVPFREDADLVLDRLLADEVVERARPQCSVRDTLGLELLRADHTLVSHRAAPAVSRRRNAAPTRSATS